MTSTAKQRHRAGVIRVQGRGCLMAKAGGCSDGRTQAHHVIPCQTIRHAKEHASLLAKENRLTIAGQERIHETPLNELYADERNGIMVCEHHHLYEAEIDRDFLPVSVDEFAADFALSWFLDRHFGGIVG